MLTIIVRKPKPFDAMPGHREWLPTRMDEQAIGPGNDPDLSRGAGDQNQHDHEKQEPWPLFRVRIADLNDDCARCQHRRRRADNDRSETCDA